MAELREILEKLYRNEYEMDIDQAISEIKSLIKEKLPKTRFLFVGNVEANKGYNLALTEIEKIVEEI